MRQVDNMWITLQGVNNSCCYVCLRDIPLNVTLIQNCKYTVSDRGLSTYFFLLDD